MGIHGLTTYLRESRTTLVRTVTFPICQDSRPTTIVVDGWSFIFELASWAGLPWIYGGEYEAFSHLITDVVTAWRSVGLNMCFVFDGAYPALKYPTLVSRQTQTTIQVGQVFFRTSSAARSTPRFLRENSLLPPLSFAACVQTLRHLVASSAARGEPPWLELHFADEEGDPYAVALAARLNAYVVGRDSDYVVLNADGYQGYIPLDEMVWVAESAFSETGSLFSNTTDGDDGIDENGFRTVRKTKSRRREQESALVGRGIIPPPTTDGTTLSLVCNVYTPTALANKLQIPTSLLPLLGALVGNDFTSASGDTVPAAALRSRNLQYMFFERHLTLSQRITRVADTLRELLGPEQKRKRRKQPIGSVMELIDAAVHALLLRPPDTLASGEIEAIVERIVEATLQYAIPRSDTLGASPDACALHGEGACRLVDFFSRLELDASSRDERSSGEDEAYQVEGSIHAQVRKMYVAAYRRGELSPRALDVLSTGTAWARLALEDPDKESVSRSVTRPIRLWCYAILDAGVGLPTPPQNEQEEEIDSGDELVDVVEEDSDSDYLSPLRTALERLDNSALASDPSHIPSIPLAPPPRPKIVTEYLRRSTRVASEEVEVPFLGTLLEKTAIDDPESQHAYLPIQLWPEEHRLTFLLRSLGSDTSHIRDLHGPQLTTVLSLRWVVMRMQMRAEESPSQREKQLERWTREEVHAFLSAFSWSESSQGSSTTGGDAVNVDEPIPIEERNIQLVTQVSLACDAIEQFAQVLFLRHIVPNPMVHFSGVRLHRALTTQPGSDTSGVDEELLQACLDGLESALTTKPTKAKKKRKDRVAAESVSPSTPHRNTQRRGPATAGNMYDVLAAMNA